MADTATSFPGARMREAVEQYPGQAVLEHVNVTTFSARETAQLFVDVFGWHIRWEGQGKLGGHSIHVGTEGTYVVLYTPPEDQKKAAGEGQPNHVGVCVIWTRQRKQSARPVASPTHTPTIIPAAASIFATRAAWNSKS